ncbi:TrkH family potassium uptake protein, partial [Candidatus Bipolaricaulota bacterium]|nr:TrkH family potassium uptake protein [Candidatus Bipolaricaulota bacterium]
MFAQEATIKRVSTVFHYLGIVCLGFAVLQALPLLISSIFAETVRFPMRIYMIPAASAAAVGILLISAFRPHRLSAGAAMAVAAIGWIGLSMLGALPYWIALDLSYLDALIEAVSGLTTTGVTVLRGLDGLPNSLLFWRAMTQWVGGLGIFTLFLTVALRGESHGLLAVEAHTAFAQRLSPGLFASLRKLWLLYVCMTVVCGVVLWLEGMSPFDAVAHALTTVSTGGFSTHDANIGYFRAAGYEQAAAIEATIVVFMLLGATSFLLLWNLLRGKVRRLFANGELRVWLLMMVGAGIVVWVGAGAASEGSVSRKLGETVFHVASIGTSTGFTTRALADPWFSDAGRLVLIGLTVVGGCIGSTAGGLKVLRVTLLTRLARHQLLRSTRTPHEHPILIHDGAVVGQLYMERT